MYAGVMREMASGYGTELQVMEQASNHVRDVNQQIQSQLRTLMSNIEPLASAWKGSASVSFMTLQQRWQDNAQKLNKALSEIAEALSQSKVTYQTSDEQQASSFGNISGALG